MSTPLPPPLPNEKSPFDRDPKAWLKKHWPRYSPLWLAPVAFALLPGHWKHIAFVLGLGGMFSAGPLWRNGDISYFPHLGFAVFVPFGIWILLLRVTAPFGGLPN